MITPEQIRAARAILKWGQNDLAAASDVSVPSIANIETERQKPHDTTLRKIHDALHAAGVEFIEGGVRRTQNLIRIYEGDDCYLRLMDDAFLALSKEKGEILLSGADERRSTPEVTEKTRAMRRSGIRMRFLVQDKNTFLMGPPDEYRWLDDSLYVDGDVKVIFADTVAYLMTWHGTPRAVMINDKTITEENRRIFNFLWNISRKPTHTTATESYTEEDNKK